MLSKEASSNILDDAREKIALEISHYANFHSPSDEDYIPPKVFASQILAISGTTDIECPECDNGYVRDRSKRLSFVPCPKCQGYGAIKHKWKVSVVLENGELPEVDSCLEEVGRLIAVTAQSGMKDAKYKQVVE